MKIENKHTALLTDEQAAVALDRVQMFRLEGCTVHLGRHATSGQAILIEASAGMSLLLTDEAGLDVSVGDVCKPRL